MKRSAVTMSSLYALANSTPAKHTMGIRKSPSTDSHMPTLMSAMVCAAMLQGPEWTKARVIVDVGSEHSPFLDQKLADSLPLGGPLVGGATQADGAFLPLRDVGSVDIIVNGLPVSQKFMSAPFSHYDVILDEPWCSDDGLLSPISFGSSVQTDTHTPSPSLAAIDAQHKHTERAHMLSAAVEEGVRRANTEPQLLATQLAVKDIFCAHQQAMYETIL